jgi:hypothetical protein
MITSRRLSSTSPGPRRRLGLGAYPATLLIGGLIVSMMAVTVGSNERYHRLSGQLKSSWWLLHGSGFYRLFTSAFLQSRAGFVVGIVLLLPLLPLAEHKAGSAVAAAAFFLGDWVSSLSVMVGLRLMVALDSPGRSTAVHALAHADSGASAGLYACGAAFVWSLTDRRWKIALGAALVTDLAIEAVVTHSLASVQHPIAVGIGIGIAALVTRRSKRPGQ